MAGACSIIARNRRPGRGNGRRSRQRRRRPHWPRRSSRSNGLKAITDAILARHDEVSDVKDMNDLARDELGLHLTIFAEVEGREVKARVTPVCGFRDSEVECEKATAVSGGSVRRGFPIEAKLS